MATKTLEGPKKKYKFPKELGSCLARLATVQKAAEKLAAQMRPWAEEEKAMRDHLIEKFPKDKLKGAKGSGLSLSLFPFSSPQIEDWDTFYNFASKKANRDLLVRGISRDAWKERVEAGKTVPGIKVFKGNTLRVSKDKAGK